MLTVATGGTEIINMVCKNIDSPPITETPLSKDIDEVKRDLDNIKKKKKLVPTLQFFHVYDSVLWALGRSILGTLYYFLYTGLEELWLY